MEIHRLIEVLRRWWPALLLVPLLGGLLGSLVADGIAPTYEAETRFLVGPITVADETLRAAAELTTTYGELVTSQVVLEPAIRALGRPISAAQITASANSSTRLVTIRVQDGDPDDAAAVANTLVEELVLFTGSGRAGTTIISVVDGAEPPTNPIAPDKVLITGMAGVASLLLVMATVLLVEYFDTSVGSRTELARAAGQDVLGVIPVRKHPLHAGLMGLAGNPFPESSQTTAYRVLAARIEQGTGQPAARTILVVSASARSAEFTVNLAAALSSGGKRVALVDADPGGGQVTQLFALMGQPGLTDLLVASDSEQSIATLLARAEEDLAVMPRGRGRPSSGLVTPGTAGQVLEELLSVRDMVVLDAGLASEGASLAWACLVDAVIVVAHRKRTTEREVNETVLTLQSVGSNVLGPVLLEGAPPRLPRFGGPRPPRLPRRESRDEWNWGEAEPSRVEG